MHLNVGVTVCNGHEAAFSFPLASERFCRGSDSEQSARTAAALNYLSLNVQQSDWRLRVVCVNPPKQQADFRHDFLPPLPPGKIAEEIAG